MAHIRTKGFVLSSVPYGESNRLVRILTPEYGILLCGARGATRVKSPLRAISDPFVFAEFELFYYRDRYHVNSGQGLAWFLDLREDIDRLTCAAHLAEVFLDGLKDSEPIPAAYKLWAYTAQQLSETEDALLDVHIAQLRLLAEIGFCPYVGECKQCGSRSDTMYFSFSDGAVFCPDAACKREMLRGEIMTLSADTIASISYYTGARIERLFHPHLSRAVRREFIAFSDKYLTYIMRKQYKHLDLIKDLDTFQSNLSADYSISADK